MSAFYVGVRFRCVAVDWPEWSKLVGEEGFICGADERGNWIVSLAGNRFPCAKDHAPRYFAPILPDGLESLEEINALYEPSPEVVTVEKRA